MSNFAIIRELAEERKITIRDLSARIGMTAESLHAMIKKGSTNTLTIEAIARELEVPVGVFFDKKYDVSRAINDNVVNMELFSERLRSCLELKGITMSKMAKDLGIPESTIPFLTVAGRLPAAATARTVANYLGVSTEWLYTGKGPVTNEIHKEIDADSHTTDTINRNSIETPNNEICLYDVSAAAGRGSFDEIIQKDKLVDKFVIPAFHDVSWMIYVKGSSMYPKYSSGDIIACRVLNDSKFIQWGKVYVVATKEQGLLVKRLKKSEREDCITAISDNTIYDPFDIPKDEILGLALVLGVIRME